MIEQYLPQLQEAGYKVAYNILRNREDAEDCVQQSLMRAIRFEDTYRGEAALKSWFTRIVINEARTHLRRKRVRRSNDHVAIDSAHEIPASAPSALYSLIEAEKKQIAKSLVKKLPPKQRQYIEPVLTGELAIDQWAHGGDEHPTLKTYRFRAVARMHDMCVRKGYCGKAQALQGS